MLKASKLWMLGPQECILQHLLELKLALRLVSETINNVFSEGYYVEENTQISWLRLQNCACQAFRTPFSNSFLSLRSAQKVVPKI